MDIIRTLLGFAHFYRVSRKQRAILAVVSGFHFWFSLHRQWPLIGLEKLPGSFTGFRGLLPSFTETRSNTWSVVSDSYSWFSLHRQWPLMGLEKLLGSFTGFGALLPSFTVTSQVRLGRRFAVAGVESVDRCGRAQAQPRERPRRPQSLRWRSSGSTIHSDFIFIFDFVAFLHWLAYPFRSGCSVLHVERVLHRGRVRTT